LETWELPAELKGVERDLTGRPRPDPSAELRQRVINGVRAELAQDRVRGRWAFAAAVAATVLVWANLSLCAVQATDYRLDIGAERPSADALAEQIRQLVPDISEREALRQAVLLRAVSSLAPLPDVPAPSAAQDRFRALDDLLQ